MDMIRKTPGTRFHYHCTLQVSLYLFLSQGSRPKHEPGHCNRSLSDRVTDECFCGSNNTFRILFNRTTVGGSIDQWLFLQSVALLERVVLMDRVALLFCASAYTSEVVLYILENMLNRKKWNKKAHKYYRIMTMCIVYVL